MLNRVPPALSVDPQSAASMPNLGFALPLTRVLTLTVVLTAAGCSLPGNRGGEPSVTPPAPAATEPTLGQVASDPYPGTQRRVMFRCATGEELEMRFFPVQGVAVLVREGRNAELQQMPAASGFRYEGAGYRALGKGRALRIEQDGVEPLDCVGLSVKTDGGK